MIKKTLRNAAVGTIAAGAMILPAATTVAPQMQLMACNYPDSRDTAVDQTLSKYALSKGKVRSFVTVNNLDGAEAPNGEITVTMYNTNGDAVKSKSKDIKKANNARKFTFGGFGKKKQGTYRFVASFNGGCKYSNSFDEDYATVTR